MILNQKIYGNEVVTCVNSLKRPNFLESNWIENYKEILHLRIREALADSNQPGCETKRKMKRVPSD